MVFYGAKSFSAAVGRLKTGVCQEQIGTKRTEPINTLVLESVALQTWLYCLRLKPWNWLCAIDICRRVV